MEGKALCALLQIYEVGLSCNLGEQSQQMTCVHARATSRGTTLLGWASSVLESGGSPQAKLILLPPTPRDRGFFLVVGLGGLGCGGTGSVSQFRE